MENLPKELTDEEKRKLPLEITVDFETSVLAHSDKLQGLRAQRRARAASNGKTVEQELDEFEALIHCKEYVDILRVLLGVDIRQQ